jgi:hypothetical protein
MLKQAHPLCWQTFDAYLKEWMFLLLMEWPSLIPKVQAVGRAIRKATNKKKGLIILPVFIDANDDPEINLEESCFKPIWKVLNALRSHDDILAEELDHLRLELGRRTFKKPPKLSKITIDLPVSIDSTFSDYLRLKILENTSSSWLYYFGLLERFKEENGHCNVPRNSKNASLAIWMSKQRNRKESLPQDYIDKLNAIGFEWDPLHARWESMFVTLLQYKSIHDDCNVPQKYTPNRELGTWVSEQRINKNRGSLTQKRINRLNEIGFDWEPFHARWESMFVALLQYKAMHGDCNVPRGYPRDPALSTWVSEQRTRKKDKSLSQERINRLNEICFDWDLLDTQWKAMFAALLQYKEMHGHYNVPNEYSQNPPLGIWVEGQRGKKRKGKLSQEYINRLDAIGFDWNPLETQWEAMFVALLRYKAIHGDCNVPRGYSQDPLLSRWITTQRIKKNGISQERINRLNEIGFDWDPFHTRWKTMFAALLQYKEIHGHYNVPSKYPQNPALGTWVEGQRGKKRKGKLSQEYINELNAIEFDWEPLDTQWERMFAALLQYKAIHGDCNVPQKYLQNSKLGSWVSGQRTRKKKNSLSQECVHKLEQIGFKWSVDQAKAKNIKSINCLQRT